MTKTLKIGTKVVINSTARSIAYLTGRRAVVCDIVNDPKNVMYGYIIGVRFDKKTATFVRPQDLVIV